MDERIIRRFLTDNAALPEQLLRALCGIPAPSHKEDERAAFCKKWLEDIGAEGVYIDEAKNVIFPIGCDGKSDITVFAAHTDTVFPDLEPMPYVDDGERIHCPGVGDDTASVVTILLAAKFFVENHIEPPRGVLFVCNSCEEGLGNLKGSRRLFDDFAGRIGRFVTVDGTLDEICNRCVGSHRYRVTVKTPGGHSFSCFGNTNAIAVLSQIVRDIYSLEVPKKEGARTTYNVGTITGGTSVNTIAQEAEMLCEYRSSDVMCLAEMRSRFAEIFARYNKGDATVTAELIGERPCADGVDAAAQAQLETLCAASISAVTGEKTPFRCGSTDCNIPQSRGIPAVCVGGYYGEGEHTREEWIEKRGLPIGTESTLRLALKLTTEAYV